MVACMHAYTHIHICGYMDDALTLCQIGRGALGLVPTSVPFYAVHIKIIDSARSCARPAFLPQPFLRRPWGRKERPPNEPTLSPSLAAPIAKGGSIFSRKREIKVRKGGESNQDVGGWGARPPGLDGLSRVNGLCRFDRVPRFDWFSGRVSPRDTGGRGSDARSGHDRRRDRRRRSVRHRVLGRRLWWRIRLRTGRHRRPVWLLARHRRRVPLRPLSGLSARRRLGRPRLRLLPHVQVRAWMVRRRRWHMRGDHRV